jgi:hypothetical protein
LKWSILSIGLSVGVLAQAVSAESLLNVNQSPATVAQRNSNFEQILEQIRAIKPTNPIGKPNNRWRMYSSNKVLYV